MFQSSHNSLWAISPDFDLVSFFNSEKDAVALASNYSNQSNYTKAGEVAILPLQGLIVQKESWITKYGLGTSTETFGQWFDIAIRDKSIGDIPRCKHRGF